MARMFFQCRPIQHRAIKCILTMRIAQPQKCEKEVACEEVIIVEPLLLPVYTVGQYVFLSLAVSSSLLNG
jgi:hypothetical protein